MSPLSRTLASAVLAAALVLTFAAPSGATGGAPGGGVFHVYETPGATSGAGDPVVALTFDDGPHAKYTPQILDILNQYGVKATFFELGREAERHPDLVQRIVAEGHVVANHTWDHKDLRPMSDEEFIFEVDHTTEVLESISGQRQVCVRPPYGKSDARVTERLAARGQTSVLWTSDSRDFEKPGVAAIVENSLAHLQPGGVILMHDGGGTREQTIAALPQVIERVRAAGYSFAPICAPDPHAPVGGLATAEAQPGGRIAVGGWAADPDTPDPLDVHLYLDGTHVSTVKASAEGTPGPRFETTLRAVPGSHQVCAYGINVGPPSANATLGCTWVEVAPLTAFDDLHRLAAKVRFVQLREQAEVLRRVTLVHDARRTPWAIRARALGPRPN